MNKNTKILCVCRSGYVRSVGTKRELNKRGYDNVLSVGSYITPIDTLKMLCEWADVILLAKPEHGEYILFQFKKKINDKFYIGDDLEITVSKQLDKIGLI